MADPVEPSQGLSVTGSCKEAARSPSMHGDFQNCASVKKKKKINDETNLVFI